MAAGAVALLTANATSTGRPAPHRPGYPQAAIHAQVQPITSATAGPDLGAMAAMVAALKTTGHNVVMTTKGSSMAGIVNPTANAASAVAKGSGVELDEVVNNGKIFIKADLGATLDTQAGISPNVWMQVDPKKVSQNNELLIQPDASDPVDLTGIMAGVTALQQRDAQHLQGTLDLRKVTGHTLPDPSEVARAGTPATHVPFTVAADSNGRISAFHVDASAFDPALTLDVAYSKYGAPDPVVEPASSVPAPATLYRLFNN
jgi:hypothetical protein